MQLDGRQDARIDLDKIVPDSRVGQKNPGDVFVFLLEAEGVDDDCLVRFRTSDLPYLVILRPILRKSVFLPFF